MVMVEDSEWQALKARVIYLEKEVERLSIAIFGPPNVEEKEDLNDLIDVHTPGKAPGGDMCVYSMVVDLGQELHKQYPGQDWDWNTVQQFLEVLRRLDEIDKKLGLKDCADEEKDAFMKKVFERVDALEAEFKSIKKTLELNNRKVKSSQKKTRKKVK